MRKLFSTRYSDNAVTMASLLLRLAGGALMIPHGFDKLTHFSQYSAQFMNLFHMGKPATLSLVIFAEFFCSAFLILGLFTRLATIPLIITMCVALFQVHNGQVFGDGGTAAMFFGIFLGVLCLGPGKISVDKLIAG